jgi:nucleotide-binding universal stress UspA family protein
MFPFRKILVALGSTKHDSELLRYASMLAESPGEMAFRFVHVSATGEDDPGQVRDSIDNEERFNEQVLSQFAPDRNRVRASCHVLKGHTLDRLLEFTVQEDTDLILIGHRQAKRGRRSMARRMAMKAPCSLWLVPAGSPATITRVLVAVDFSRHSALALSIGSSVVASRGLQNCLAVNVQFNQIDIGRENTSSTARLITKSDFDEFVRSSNLHGVSVQVVIKESASVARAVLDTAKYEGVDLVILGTRGRSPSAAVLLGSETEEVIMQTAVPVLIVKQIGERASLLQTLRGFRQRNDPVHAS